MSAEDVRLSPAEWDVVFEARLVVVNSYGFDLFALAEDILKLRAVLEALSDPDGEHISKSRDFGRGVAHAVHAIRLALDWDET